MVNRTNLLGTLKIKDFTKSLCKLEVKILTKLVISPQTCRCLKTIIRQHTPKWRELHHIHQMCQPCFLFHLSHHHLQLIMQTLQKWNQTSWPTLQRTSRLLGMKIYRNTPLKFNMNKIKLLQRWCQASKFELSSSKKIIFESTFYLHQGNHSSFFNDVNSLSGTLFESQSCQLQTIVRRLYASIGTECS